MSLTSSESIVMSNYILKFFRGVDRLVVLVEQLNAVFSEKQNDLLLNMLVFKSFDDSVSVLLTKFLSQSGGNLSSNLSHDLHVGSLGNFLTDFNKVSFGIGLFNSGLRDILIKNLPVELFGVAINQIVIEFTSMGFHKI